MKKQKKQNILNAIIVILVIALILMIGSIVYEEKINMDKQKVQDTVAPVAKDEGDVEGDDEQTEVKDEVQDEEEVKEPTEENDEYTGEEEQESSNEEDITQSKDEKAIDLVKKEWGDDDSVTFSIVNKKGTIYRVAITSSESETLKWYEVDTETWEVSEF